MFAYMEAESGVLELAPGAMEVRMLAVDSEWRGRGVATALLDASRRAAQKAQCPYIKLYCTSNHSSRLMEKLGWRLVYSLSYEEYEAINRCGIVLPPEPHRYCKLYVDSVQLDKVRDVINGQLPNKLNAKLELEISTMEKLW